MFNSKGSLFEYWTTFLSYLFPCIQNVFVACFAVVCKSMTLLVSGVELIQQRGRHHRPLSPQCAALSHHTGPLSTITIDHYSPIEISRYWNLRRARARDNNAALCCCVSGREIPHPAAILQLSWARACIQFPRFEKCETAANQIWSGLKALNQHNHFS